MTFLLSYKSSGTIRKRQNKKKHFCSICLIINLIWNINILDTFTVNDISCSSFISILTILSVVKQGPFGLLINCVCRSGNKVSVKTESEKILYLGTLSFRKMVSGKWSGILPCYFVSCDSSLYILVHSIHISKPF